MKRNRTVFSVYPNKEEAEKLKNIISESNLSTSQFFITQALSKPFSKPLKKALPKDVKKQILNLEKLSGLLSLSLLKTKDKEMVMENWMITSQNVKWISNLVLLKIFEEFELFHIKRKLEILKSNLHQLSLDLEIVNDEDFRIRNYQMVQKMSLNVSEVKRQFEEHYKIESIPHEYMNIWEADFDIHHEIEILKRAML